MTKTRKEIINRILKSIFGLFVFSIGEYLTIVANIGLTPWDSLTMAVASKTGITFGKISIVTGLIIVLIDLVLKEKVGVGTILDALLVGTFIDIFTALFKLKSPSSVFVGIIYDNWFVYYGDRASVLYV